jgi:hypothetical protein
MEHCTGGYRINLNNGGQSREAAFGTYVVGSYISGYSERTCVGGARARTIMSGTVVLNQLKASRAFLAATATTAFQ